MINGCSVALGASFHLHFNLVIEARERLCLKFPFFSLEKQDVKKKIESTYKENLITILIKLKFFILRLIWVLPHVILF